jgi:hypothetical protein
MAAPTSVDFKATFSLNSTPKQFTFVDTTDYAGQGVPLTEVHGVFKVVSPSGVTSYNNTTYASPDINVDVSTTNSTTIPIPLDANSKPEVGTYTITYSVEWDDGVLASTVTTKQRTFEFCYASPTAVVKLSSNCITPLLTSLDSTNYVVDGVTPTITRTHTLYYPPSLGLADVTGTAAQLTTSTFYTGTQSSKISSVLLYTVNANFLITDTISGGDELSVDCNNNLCAVFCCVENLYVRFKNAQTRNKVQADELNIKLQEIGYLLILLQSAYDCGESGQINKITQDILDIAECTSDCDCDGDTPTLVTGAGISKIAVVTEGGGIDVTVNVSGNTTTYTVELEPALLTKLNASYNSTVVAGTGIGVTTATDGSGNKTYTVALTGTLYSPNMMTLRSKIEYSSFANPTVAITNQVISSNGTNMKATVTVESVNAGDPTWKSQNNLFKVSVFQNTNNDNYKVHLEPVNMGTTATEFEDTPLTWTAAQQHQLQSVLGVDLLNQTSGVFYFSFVVPSTGKRYTNEDMLRFTEIILNTRIEE